MTEGVGSGRIVRRMESSGCVAGQRSHVLVGACSTKRSGATVTPRSARNARTMRLLRRPRAFDTAAVRYEWLRRRFPALDAARMGTASSSSTGTRHSRGGCRWLFQIPRAEPQAVAEPIHPGRAGPFARGADPKNDSARSFNEWERASGFVALARANSVSAVLQRGLLRDWAQIRGSIPIGFAFRTHVLYD